jgi:hypothetical protein
MNEPDFRDYSRLPDEQAENILAMTDDVGASRKTAELRSAPVGIYSNAMRQEQRRRIDFNKWK